MARWNRVLVLVIVSMICVGVMAQTTPRDYALSTPEVTYSDDNSLATISVDITNNGGDATQDAEVNIIQDGVGLVLESITLPPQPADETITVEFEIQLADFDPGDVFFAVEAGIDQFELAGSPIARDNRALVRVTVPEGAIPVQPTDEPEVTDIDDNPDDFDLFIPVIDAGINFLDSSVQVNQTFYPHRDILIVVGGVAVTLFILWFITLILRLLFRRPPTFGVWQPPYAYNSYHDPNSTMGRRQGWQTHAQNGTIFEACSPNNVVAIKRLTDMEGNPIGEWDIKAIRTVQYDMYGRISRTEVIMPKKVLKKLNKIARRSDKYDNPTLRKKITPVAKSITKRAGKPINKKSAMLPIALDLRFEGKHGEVRIMFELYQCQQGAWHLIDQWEPEMAVIGHKIVENYTYTLNGQLPGESYKEYKKRLGEDMAWILSGMLYHHQQPDDPEPDMVPPDTLTGMAPITEENMRPVELDDDTDKSAVQ